MISMSAAGLVMMEISGLGPNAQTILFVDPACVSLAGSNAVHYVCDEKSNWYQILMISNPKDYVKY